MTNLLDKKKFLAEKLMGFQFRSDMPLDERLKIWFPERGGSDPSELLEKLEYCDRVLLYGKLPRIRMVNFVIWFQNPANAEKIFDAIFQVVKGE